MAARRVVSAVAKPRPAKKKEVTLVCCGECGNVTLVTEFHTLTVHGREPTLGRCPYWTESRSLLLSQKIECKHYKTR